MNGTEDHGNSKATSTDPNGPNAHKEVRMDVNIAKSIKKLREEKLCLQARLTEVDRLLDKSSSDKENLLCLCEKLKTWAEKIKMANRNNQGVPYIRDIKVVCNEILTEIRKDEFQKRYIDMLQSDIPCFSLVSDGMKSLEKVCSKVLQNEANYNATWVEEIRQLIGRLTGSANAILDLHFEE